MRSSPRCTRGASLEVLTLTDYGDTVLSSLHATALKMSLPTRPRFLGDFLRVAVGDRHAKTPKGFVGWPNRCAVSVGQMAKVEPRETVRKGVPATL